MVMKRLKMLIAAVGLVALAAIVIYQQTRIDRFAAEAAVLREQVQRLASVPSAPERPTKPQPGEEMRSNSVPSLSGAQFSELLRLRGEVAVLKGQRAEVVVREASQQTQYQDVVTQLVSVKGEAASEMRRAAFNEDREAKLLVTAQNTLGALASALNVPESVSKVSSEEGLRDESFKQYRAYFFFKRGCEEMQTAVESQSKASAPAQ
jgi:hypothetical protein